MTMDFGGEACAHSDESKLTDFPMIVVEANDVLLNITGASVARCCLAPLASCQPA
jgi:type I restriction enzyme S subunit